MIITRTECQKILNKLKSLIEFLPFFSERGHSRVRALKNGADFFLKLTTTHCSRGNSDKTNIHYRLWGLICQP